MRNLLALVAVIVLGGLAPVSSQAAEGPWSQAPEVEARLISAVNGVGGLDSIPAGLQVFLPQGWKTYWRSPGDAGLPVLTDWSGSENVADVAFSWPAPHRFTLFGLDTFGYEYEVIFPLDVTPAAIGQPVELNGQVNMLVCSDICIPHTLNVSLSLPQATADPDAPMANLIDRFAAKVPDDGMASGFSLTSATLGPAGSEFGSVSVTVEAREPFVEPDVIIETERAYAFATPDISVSEDGLALTAAFSLTHEPDEDGPLEGMPVTLTVVDGPRAMEAQATIGQALAPGSGVSTAAPVVGGSLLAMIGIALIGGLILNLMPCVLPVLSLKLFSFASLGGSGAGAIRRGFLATAAGIVVSFLILGAAVAAVKATGAAVGWGLQFQQPIFLIFMIAVVGLFAANLWGLFDIGLPGGLSDGVVGATAGDGLRGHFATGAFAALLATPCSAPFVGTAVAFALTRGNMEILVIFLALGVGLAGPYLLVAAVPRLASLMPRPGRWMLALKRILALALVATAVWLAWVLSNSTTPMAAGLVVALIVAGTMALSWRGPPRLALGGAAAVAVILAFFVPALPGVAKGGSTQAVSGDWLPFEEAMIGDLVAKGEVVFVDVTADWCITCKANKTLVLERGEVAKRLTDGSIKTMQADWTRPNDAIADYLARHNRYGIPFDVVYGPSAPDGIVLPELLTPDAVLNAIRDAGA